MILEGGGNLGTYKYMYRQKGESRGSSFEPNVKKPTSWGKRGGGPDPRTPPPPDPHLIETITILQDTLRSCDPPTIEIHSEITGISSNTADQSRLND